MARQQLQPWEWVAEKSGTGVIPALELHSKEAPHSCFEEETAAARFWCQLGDVEVGIGTLITCL